MARRWEFSAGELGYYLREYANPSTSQKDWDTKSDGKNNSNIGEL